MPKIQGKQIAESTITQELLNLVTPTSGDTLSGATVEYVNNAVLQYTGGTGVIGPAEDGDYTDGLFTDFTENTPVGTAVDRFNEVLLKLAPLPPNDDWTNVFSNLGITSTEYDNMATAGTGAIVNNITTDTTPDYGLTVTLPTEGMNGDTGTFTMTGPSGVLDTVTLTTGDDTRVNDISLTEGDPYDGQSGKAGFYSGVTSMSVSGTLPTITASATQQSISFTHPGTDSPESYSFYVDSASTPTIGSTSATFPTMTRYISGVPSLDTGDSITAIGFTISSAVGFFYNPSMWRLTGTNVNNTSYTAPTSTPSANSDVTETGQSVTISGGYAESISFDVEARNIAGTTGSGTISSGTYRVDTVSNESSRLISGSGSYPATGWGGVYDSTQTLTGTYTDEMMLLNGTYQYPTGNYTTIQMLQMVQVLIIHQ
jgi:hypothetical protein